MTKATITLEELLSLTNEEYSRIPEDDREQILKDMEINLDKLRLPDREPERTLLRQSLIRLIELDQDDWDSFSEVSRKRILKHLDLLEGQRQSKSIKL